MEARHQDIEIYISDTTKVVMIVIAFLALTIPFVMKFSSYF